MDEREDPQRRLRRAAVTRFGVAPEAVSGEDEAEPPGPASPGSSGSAGSAEKTDEDDNAASQRMEQQGLWVEFQVRKAMERGEFDNLPGAGKPLDLPPAHDPDWWVKRLIERENIQGVAPPAIGLRREDAELESVIDREWAEDGVRRVVGDFNRRVIEARRQLTGGPPVITKPRDADLEVEAWRERRTAAKLAARRRQAEQAARTPAPVKRPWWRRPRP